MLEVTNIIVTDQAVLMTHFSTLSRKTEAGILESFINACYSVNRKLLYLKDAEGGISMKKIGLGISILLFAVVFYLCSDGLEKAALMIGLVGLVFSMIGYFEKEKPTDTETVD